MYVTGCIQFNLNPSAWQCQSTALDYSYKSARQCGTTGSYHPVTTKLKCKGGATHILLSHEWHCLSMENYQIWKYYHKNTKLAQIMKSLHSNKICSKLVTINNNLY